MDGNFASIVFVYSLSTSLISLISDLWKMRYIKDVQRLITRGDARGLEHWIACGEPRQLICESYFLLREGYIDKGGEDDNLEFLELMPAAFRSKPAQK